MESEVRSGARVLIDGLKARPELNGASGTITGDLNEETGRWNVMVDDMREALALKPANLSVDEKWAGIVVGTVVRLSGLVDKQELYNGKTGTVRSFAGDFCSVYVEAERESVAVKRPCMVVAEEAPSGKGAVDISESDELPIQVSCNGVTLKLTLSAKQQAKPFADAVVKPFLKAYSKKKNFDGVVEIKDVAQITVDSDSQTELQVLKDIQIFSAEAILKGSRGDIEIEIQLKDPSKAPKPPPPKHKPKDLLPKDARVIIHGLTSSAGQELNGMEGRTCGYHEDKGRYDVRLTDGRIVSARMDNLIDLGSKQL